MSLKGKRSAAPAAFLNGGHGGNDGAATAGGTDRHEGAQCQLPPVEFFDWVEMVVAPSFSVNTMFGVFAAGSELEPKASMIIRLRATRTPEGKVVAEIQQRC